MPFTPVPRCNRATQGRTWDVPESPRYGKSVENSTAAMAVFVGPVGASPSWDGGCGGFDPLQSGGFRNRGTVNSNVKVMELQILLTYSLLTATASDHGDLVAALPPIHCRQHTVRRGC